MRLNIKTFLLNLKIKILEIITNYTKQPMFFFLVTCIVLLTVVKLNLIGTGFLAFPDEFRYLSSGNIVSALSELKIEDAIKTIFSTQGRPVETIIKMIPSALQFVSANVFNQNCYESNNSYPLFIFNFIIYCFILIVHFKFSKIVLKDEILALISVLLYCSLTNSYIYLRHALPYDSSLLVFYLIIYKTVFFTENENLSLKRSFFLGIVSFIAYLVYPGYFTLYSIALLILFFNSLTRNNFLNTFFYSCFYIFGSIFCLIIFEVMARLVGVSYLGDALSLSATITQGSFDESFTFIIKYLFDVEFLNGIFIMISLVVFCFIIIYLILKKTFKQHFLIILLGILISGMYLTYASMGYFLHKMVFYGRLLHQYIPFICLLSMFSINELLKKSKKKVLILVMISMVFVVQFGFNFSHYCSFSYPRDVSWKISKMDNLKDVENVYEYENNRAVLPFNSEFKKNTESKMKTDSLYSNILALNCFYIYPVNDLSKYHLFHPKENYVLLESRPHFLNFKAYQYEGFTLIDRINLDKINLQIKVFKK
jgi:hypothetical protein